MVNLHQIEKLNYTLHAFLKINDFAESINGLFF